MNHKTDMREALRLCVDVMLHDGVPTDPEHPKRIALNAAEAILAFRPDALTDERGAFEEKFAVPDSIVWRDERYHVLGVTTGSHQVERFCGRWDGWQARASMAPTPQQISDYLSGLDAINRALVEREARAAAPQAEAAQSEDRIDALQDMAFANGLQLGWNFGSNGAREDYEQALKARDGYVRVLRETRAAPSPDREQVGEDDSFVQVPTGLTREEKRKLILDHADASPSRECGEQGAACAQNSAKHRYFVYDPEGNGFDLYDTDAQRDAAHQAAIAEARQEAMDDGEWTLDVECIVSGFVTHATVATEMDDGGCDYAPLSVFSASAPTLGEQPQAAEPKGLTDEQREIIRQAANCLEFAITLTQDGYDGEPGPASEWDHGALRLVVELRALLAEGE